MILVDTNVLGYAAGAEHPLRAPCQRLLQAQADGRVELATTVKVLEEFVQVRSRRRQREDAARLARSYFVSMIVIETTLDDFDDGLDLFERHRRLDAFDAMLAAVALRIDAQALVSADRGFGEVTGLRHVDPGTPELDQLIASTSA